MTQLIKGYDQSICNHNRKLNAACDPSKKQRNLLYLCVVKTIQNLTLLDIGLVLECTRFGIRRSDVEL